MRIVARQLAQYGLVLGIVLTSVASQKPVINMNSTEAGTETDGAEDVFDGLTYSVIVVASNPRPSNQFRDEERVRHFNRFSGRRDVVSIQFGDPSPDKPPGIDEPIFGARHPDDVDKRVRLIFRPDVGHRPSEAQVAHLRAACSGGNETTVIITVDETCQFKEFPQRFPPTCASNVMRVYPFNSERPDLEVQEAYMPLGPRNSFPFVPREVVAAASNRSLFFNLQVSTYTSPRRRSVVEIVERYSKRHPEVPNKSQQENVQGNQWQDLLLDSTFTVCPGGHNAETFRMWEALEAGSIPIVSKLDYTHPRYKLHDHDCGTGSIGWNTVAYSPFVKEASVEVWDDLPMLLDRLWQMSDEELKMLQDDCMAWYTARMNHMYDSLLNFGEGRDMFPQLGPIQDIVEDRND